MRREDYPPDTVTTQAPGPLDGTCTGFCYDQYVDRQHNGPYDNPPPPPAANDGVPDRRKVAVPIGDCRNLGGGNTEYTRDRYRVLLPDPQGRQTFE